MSTGRERAETGDPVRAPVTGSRYLQSALAEWQATDSPGFWIKPLYENAARGEQTLLMKVDPGAFAPLHAHDEFEQVYVLEGSFYDEEKRLEAGDYCCRAAGAMHTAGSDGGAIVLLVYTREGPNINSPLTFEQDLPEH
jgi:anti-sigma factor ChrR (cupin superfamily)